MTDELILEGLKLFGGGFILGVASVIGVFADLYGEGRAGILARRVDVAAIRMLMVPS